MINSITSERKHKTPRQGLNRETAWTGALAKLTNWTAPGPDEIPGYWLNTFKGTTAGSKVACEWKNGSDSQRGRHGRTGQVPAHHVPLQIARGHVLRKDVLPDEQKALRKGKRGCLDTLASDAAIAIETKMFGQNLLVAWVDCCKVFDMVPHKWINRMLKAIRAPIWRSESLIPKWETEIGLKNPVVHTPMVLKRGVTLSPLLFCLAIVPQSDEGQGYKSKYRLPTYYSWTT